MTDAFLINLAVLTPIGVIGIWRWSIWLLKKIVGSFYRPIKGSYTADVSIVTPVYNENPDVLVKAVESWLKNKPKEVIAVVDHSDKSSIAVFQTLEKKYPKICKYVITTIPGKREALATGIKLASYEIVALVDCDTLWSDSTLSNALKPFSMKKIGGVATRQNVLSPQTVAEKIFDMLLDLRYVDDMPFLSATGYYQRCLSGRTAFYRKAALLPVLEGLITEKFLGSKVISGDDKALTYLIQKNGWGTYYQKNSVVYTYGMKSMKQFIKQKVRWTRNSWRADIKAFFGFWVWKNPVFALGFIDSAIQPFTLLLSPAFFLAAVYFNLWIPALILVIWWHVSRLIKLFPHWVRRPQDIILLPLFIVFSFASAVIKIYALISLNNQGWITRWDKSRLHNFGVIRPVAQTIATVCIVVLAYLVVFSNIAAALEDKNDYALHFNTLSLREVAKKQQALEFKPVFTRHVVKENESLVSIAEQYNLEANDILKYNFPFLPNWNRLESGFELTIPLKDISYEPPTMFNFERAYAPGPSIYYSVESNTVYVEGRGAVVTLEDIAASDGYAHIKEVAPGIWHFTSSLYLGNGTTLRLTKSDAHWIKLESNKNGFVNILGYNTRLSLDGVKVTSWDTVNNTYDLNHADGRSYILVKANSRFDIKNSELAYLGYKKDIKTAGGTYGVSWRIPSRTFGKYLITGNVYKSKFHHNYFGAYTYGATGMVWEGNEFYENIEYGLDPHDDSNSFLVRGNVFRNNGNHGLIFSKRCFSNYIVDNKSYNNELHGIMLHEDSDSNVIAKNIVYGNRDGIAIYSSKDNLIFDNTVNNNANGVRINKNSANNIVRNNTIRSNEKSGIYIYDSSSVNYLESNYIVNNDLGIYIKSGNNRIINNLISKNRYSFALSRSRTNSIYNNIVDLSTTANIKVSVK
jgi:hyaluronan synthase